MTDRETVSEFLRTRRARITPQSAGLPAYGGNRRVPGLRREEVAELAGISATWYTWMEQGRAVNVSVETLERLANVLSLDGREREHLFLLAGHAAPPAPAEGSQQAMGLVRQTLDSLNPTPAYLLNQRWDILAWNRAATREIWRASCLIPGAIALDFQLGSRGCWFRFGPTLIWEEMHHAMPGFDFWRSGGDFDGLLRSCHGGERSGG